MKKLLYTFLVFGLFFSCSENKENDLDKANLNGEVKSVYTASFEAIEKFGEVTKGDKKQENSREYDTEFIYDDKGNLIEANRYDENNTLEEEAYEYQFDDNKNWIKKITVKDDKATFIIEREIEYYD